MNDRIPMDLRGAVMAAMRGGLNAAFVLNVLVAAILVDISGAYPWAYMKFVLRLFDVAEWLEVLDVTDEVRSLAGDGLRAAVLGGDLPMAGRSILCQVAPHGEAKLVAKAKRDGGDARLRLTSTDFHGASLWWLLDDILGGIALGGEFPTEICRAVEFVPHGVRSGLRPVRLPTGRVVDPREKCLVTAIVEERHRAEQDPERFRQVPMLKSLGIMIASGSRQRVDRTTVRKEVLDECLDLDQLVGIMTKHPERAGPDFDPLVAGMVTAKVRLAICQVVGSIRDLGGVVLHVSTDAVVVAITHGSVPTFVASPGGSVQQGRVRGFYTLPVAVVDEVLRRSGAPWKPVAGRDREALAYVCGTQKIALVERC